MKKALSILAVILGLIITIGLSIWVGFPSPQGFDRLAIVATGYGISVMLVIFGFTSFMTSLDW